LRQALRNVAQSDEWAQGEVRPDAAGHRAVQLTSYGVQLQYEREAHASGYSELR